MNKEIETHLRNIYQERISKGLLGPGSDIFVHDKDIEEEIIGDYPLLRYYSGILFPKRKKVETHSDEGDNEIRNETDSDDNYEESIESPKSEEEPINDSNKINNSNKNAGELKISNSTFFPTNIALTFCIDKSVKEIEAQFSLGLYSAAEKNIRIKTSKDVYDEFMNHSTFPFKDIINYENGYMLLQRKLKGKSRTPRTEEFESFDSFKRSDEFKDSSLKAKFHFFEKLVGRTWQRENIIIPKTILISGKNTSSEIIYERNLYKEKKHFLKVSYSVKTYDVKGNSDSIYVKIQLVNTSEPHPGNQFSNTKELLNKKCLYQAKIKVKIPALKPYKSYLEDNPLDHEGEILNYLYKDKLSYGVGHNCSVTWNKKENTIETSFLPSYDVPNTKNSFTEEDFEDNDDFISLNKSLDIYNLSHFSETGKEETINRLKSFVELYGNWIEKQKQTPSFNSKIEESIFKNLEYNLNRLRSNIGKLRDDKIFRAFRLANTAMFIQIIISNHPQFAGKEKDLNEIKKDSNYSDLEFFRAYKKEEAKRKTNNPNYKALIPAYRPFQLAFLLLNLDGITDIDSEARREVVDLIWFPTGGGKTEAYLAVAAFTILYRRLLNEKGYEGTSVIMRYTLRLLTAQQFERASRLIVALEFLRKHFVRELKREPITIGMWVGASSTPNKIGDAMEAIEKITEESNKKEGNPISKNVFQISSCSWCGTKLISKNLHNKWSSGFSGKGGKKNADFKIKCINEKCFFHNELPIQVVDEMLYQSPPTLLFGTVDKFAMLAWQPNGHRFFNSLDPDKLPPDLIIQDELHLLSGPLGSITGIFESVIESLCTKGNRKPKIISSTATTRNTDEQIKSLYGKNRRVNVFPPSGLSASDSFFAKVTPTESNRRYIGFIPTGKSSIDCQLKMLAHLFVARLEAYKLGVLKGAKNYEIFDKYWTIVSYYNSLKDVGKIHNKVGDEISTFTSTLQNTLFGANPEFRFNHAYLSNRDEELTSRISSSKIKETLKRLEENKFTDSTIEKDFKGNTFVKGNLIDLVLATNMISVGIDIDRFNLMLMNGQPRNIAEYIQASSRVGRKYKGLVVNLLDANRARDKSYFEHFISFHQAFYKSVEPISLTPFTESTVEKMLTGVIVTYIRHKIGLAADNSAKDFQPEMIEKFKEEMRSRFGVNSPTFSYFEKKLVRLSKDWIEIAHESQSLKYKSSKTEKGLLLRPNEEREGGEVSWLAMQSMREIDTNSFIKIELPKTYNNG